MRLLLTRLFEGDAIRNDSRTMMHASVNGCDRGDNGVVSSDRTVVVFRENTIIEEDGSVLSFNGNHENTSSQSVVASNISSISIEQTSALEVNSERISSISDVQDVKRVVSRGMLAISPETYPFGDLHPFVVTGRRPEMEDDVAISCKLLRERMHLALAAGGKVIQWNGSRVSGVLAMSRSIGDGYLKPWIIPDSEVTFVPPAKEDECLILASDGLWDVISNKKACEVARKWILLWHKKAR
ncbi:mitogen-activated protein kinase kinase 2-like isoform X1 [Hibiscus syriacus]|uniref:Mitogen-activated protein kinase kinase 2-like isoform X1 n=1 Tax=Hibiscus syriacus TaxID=106335 RepID=A0A6A2XHT4_HIBSY|nr:mitogen-activated protein kinase kinase 2-like isoform X1 [Hibiscus syriacus]